MPQNWVCLRPRLLIAKREAKAERHAAKRENKHGQFDNAFPAVDGDPIHEGLARTISRGRTELMEPHR